MFYTSASRYLAAKWQARVTPSNAAFKFVNGVLVNNLWELKQALRIVREDIIAEHIQNGRNDIAVWVKDVVGDKALAEELKKSNSRWGLIVALERQMMRTVNMPYYVAERWLNKVELPFNFVNGTQAFGLEDLKQALEKVDDQVVNFHMEREPNDIARWVDDIIGDYQLAAVLSESNTRSQMLTFIDDHLVMLHEALKCK